jgi:tRNA(fMet)-specific endonuclease VapC
MYLLDTDTVIYFFKGIGGVSQRLLDTEPALVSVSAVTVYGLEYGIAKSSNPRKRHTQFLHFMDEIETIPFGPREAAAAGAIRSALEKKGKPIGPYDILIAATAVAHNRILVTHNTREFKHIRGCVVEDWY